MGRTAFTEPQYLYKDALHLLPVHVERNIEARLFNRLWCKKEQ